MIKYVTEKEYEEETKNGKVLVDFFATWCGPCKMLSSVIDKFSETNDIKILKVDVDESRNLASEYNIYSIPTLIILEDGKEIKRKLGFMTKDELEAWVNE